MNRRIIFRAMGLLTAIAGALLLLPALVALFYGEGVTALRFAAVTAGSLVIAAPLYFLARPKDKTIYSRDGFVIVTLGWLILSALGAIPFVLEGELTYIDALFETVSGFTTTGATVIGNVEQLSHGLLFWRSFTHFIGGMGFLVLIMAFVSSITDRNIHIMKAEMPGPVVDKLTPRTKDTAKILYIIYGALTALEAVCLIIAKMPVFDAVTTAFANAGTGGFGIKCDSIAGYTPAAQWVVGVFMMLFGINFNLYYLLLLKKIKPVIKNSELITYISAIAVATAVITVNVTMNMSAVQSVPGTISDMTGSLGDTVRHAFFQVSSIVTTTGFATFDFTQWPKLTQSLLILLMFLGGCVGSTGGGLKVGRVMILFKSAKREIKRLIHPRNVEIVRIDGKRVAEETISNQGAYIIVYFAVLIAGSLLVSVFDNFEIETNIVSAISCLNNIGPGLNATGPAGNFSCYGNFSTLVFIALMLLGRLEIFPVILTFSHGTWKKRL